MSENLVSVCMITFNHSAFIRKAIEGVLLQRTSFKWEFVIADDFSTDGTREIIVEYKQKSPELIKLIFQEKNLGPSNNWKSLMAYPRAKYIAYFEGDDYWTDPFKLQRSVDFLEMSPGYALVCTDYDVIHNNSGVYTTSYLRTRYNLNKEIDIRLEEYIFKRYYIRTLTTMYRREILEEYYQRIDEKIIFNNAAGDLPLWLYILSTYKVRYFPDSTAVYRLSENTRSRLSDLEERFMFKKRINNVLEFYIKRNSLDSKYTKEIEIRKVLCEMEYHAQKREFLKVIKIQIRLLSRGSFRKRSLFLILVSIGIISNPGY